MIFVRSAPTPVLDVAGDLLRTSPPALRISVITREGQELASMDAGGAWAKSNICSRIPGPVGPLRRAARLLYGDDMVSNETSLSMHGGKCGASIQLVLDRRGKGKLSRICFSWFSVFYTTKRDECNF